MNTFTTQCTETILLGKLKSILCFQVGLGDAVDSTAK